MAPEQVVSSEDVGERADQFALAAIVYEMLSGRTAFPGDRVETVVYRIVHEEPTPLDGAWSPKLAAILSRALSKDPRLRFPSILDFAAELRVAVSAPRPPASGAALADEPQTDAVFPLSPATGRRRRLPAQRRAIATSGRIVINGDPRSGARR
jgi:serine/threonine-protein kinase